MRVATLASLIVFTLAGCAASPSRHGQPSITSEWQEGDFHVRFQAGPRGRDGRSFSFYEVTHKSEGKPGYSIAMESAHTLRGLRSVTDSNPKSWIRIVQAPGRRALLIEEEIPNDCGPCSNYLWIHLDSGDFIEGEYLRLPSKVTGPPGGINYRYPKVRSLDGDVLTYDYGTGAIVTKHIGRIEKSERPTPPG